MSGKHFIAAGIGNTHISLLKSHIGGFDLLISLGEKCDNRAWIHFDDYGQLDDFVHFVNVIHKHENELM